MSNPPAKLSPSTRATEIAGLCTTCVHTPTCMYAGRADTPTWHCNEFDDRVSATAPPRSALSSVPVDSGSRRDDQALALLGLCTTCDDRHTCMHVRRTGGVWHCELFR